MTSDEQRTVDAKEKNTAEKRNQNIARSTLMVMIAYAVAKAISLGQTVIIARVFGVGDEWDQFVTANRLPELIFTLIAGGALAHAFIPIFSSYLARDDKDGAWRIASQVINTVFAVTFVVSAITYFTAPWLIENYVAPGFSAAAVQQTAELMQILLISTLIFSVSGLCMGILQSHNHFLLPALAPIMFDVGILFGVIFLMEPMGVHGIAMGAVIGAALHLGIQVPGLIYYKAKWSPTFGWKNPVLWKIIRLMLPRVAGLGVFSFNFIVMNNIASRLGSGSVSALDWGWRLMQIPQTLIGTAMGVVIFPTLAALSEKGDEDGKRDAMSGALRFIMIASIPSAVGLIFVGQPLISLLERGAFDASASVLVYSTLRFFSLGLIVHCALEVIARSFYADKDTLTPLWAALGGAIINLVGSYYLSGIGTLEGKEFFNSVAYTFPTLGITPVTGNVSGLALANSLGVAFEVIVLIWVLRRRWHGIHENALAVTTIKTLIASLIMALAIVIVNSIWNSLGLNERGMTYTIIQVALETSIGAIVFGISALLLRIDEIKTIFTLVLRRKPAAEVVL